MSYFDPTLEAETVTEQQSTPVLPEERFVFELVGFERSEPDEFRAEGGVKWTWRVFHEDGRAPFVFNDEQYLFFRTTNIDKKTRKPLFTVGSSANDWASALLGRQFGEGAHVPVPELHGKRMSAMVVWERQKRDKSKWSVKLASLRHVPAAASSAPAMPMGRPSASEPSDAQVRDALLRELAADVKAARKAKLPAWEVFQDAVDEADNASIEQLQQIQANIRADLNAGAVPA